MCVLCCLRAEERTMAPAPPFFSISRPFLKTNKKAKLRKGKKEKKEFILFQLLLRPERRNESARDTVHWYACLPASFESFLIAEGREKRLEWVMS